MSEPVRTEQTSHREEYPFPAPFPGRAAIVAVTAMALALAMIPFANFTWDHVYDAVKVDVLRDWLDVAEQFPTLPFVVFALIVICVQRPQYRRAAGVLLVAVLLNMGTVEVMKGLTGRARPQYSIKMDGEKRQWVLDYLAQYPDTAIRAENVDQWLFLDFRRPWEEYSNYASFPSGHSSGAFVIASFLAILYPRTRGVWFTVAVLTALARVQSRRHWPEDVLFGAGWGFLLGNWVYAQPWAVRFGDWFAAKFLRWKPGGS